MATDTDTEREADAPEVTTPELPGASLYLLTVDQYQAMAHPDILDEDAPVELLEGVLVTKMTKHGPHIVSTMLTFHALSRVLPPGWFVTKEDPVVIRPRSEPEPDVSVIRGDIRDYLDHKPTPADATLLVEVADSSLTRDRRTKLRIYARAGIPVYWLVNLVDRRVEVYTEPTGPGDDPHYATRQDFSPDDAVPLVIDGREVARIAVREILP